MSKGNADGALPARPRPLLILYADGSVDIPGAETYAQALNVMGVITQKAKLLHEEALAQKLRGVDDDRRFDHAQG